MTRESAKTSSTRPRDAAKTRERILAAASAGFARDGYANTKVHAIAAAAGVSPNLITRYFGGKEGLFIAATQVRLKLGAIVPGPRQSLGPRLAKAIVDRWTMMEGEDPLLALLRSSGERVQAGEALSTFLDEESLVPLKRQLLHYGLSNEQAASRASAIDAFVLGVTARFRMLRSDLDNSNELEIWMAETIQSLLDAS